MAVTARCEVCGEEWKHLTITTRDVIDQVREMDYVMTFAKQSALRGMAIQWCYPNPRIRRAVRWLERMLDQWGYCGDIRRRLLGPSLDPDRDVR